MGLGFGVAGAEADGVVVVRTLVGVLEVVGELTGGNPVEGLVVGVVEDEAGLVFDVMLKHALSQAKSVEFGA